MNTTATTPPRSDPTDSAPAAAAAQVLVRGDACPHIRWKPGERLHHLFEASCDRLAAAGCEDHPAVDGPGGRLGYGQLDRLANQIAHWLRAEGVGAGDRVALLFDRSAFGYAAMLAVLKLHAAYVPLDASFPPDRIAFIAADAGVRLLLTQARHRDRVVAAGVRYRLLDEEAPRYRTLGTDRPLPEAGSATPQALCYVIYTSGSTGRPKGVPIGHAAIVNFVRVAAELYGYRGDDRVYQGLTLAFDFAVEEIWVPLALGATLVPSASGGSLVGEELARFLEVQRVTAMCCVPTLLATIDAELPGVRLVIVSGEACPRDLVARWHRPGRRFLNAYGPTETTVTATLGEPAPGRPVTIGRPLPTYAVLILAPGERRVLPFGAEGEIAIAGPGVACGYLQREDQTRKAFIDDFVGVPHNPSGRLYRTGDLGRINADGEVEYLGRIDTQVKLRGYRIELAEIESALVELPGVAQAVVTTWAAEGAPVELVAYYTLREGARPTEAGALACALRERLPAYMVPAYFECLDRMPMLACDKADRRSLPPPRGGRLRPAGRPWVAPAAGMESAIAAELAKLPGIAQVSADDDFFEHLGANSLLMAQLAARLRQRLDRPALAMRDIYGHSTVQRLAALLAQGGAAQPLRHDETPHLASRRAYVGCGVAQVAMMFAFAWAHAAALWYGLAWVVDAPGPAAAYLRGVGVGVAWFLAAALVPVALKWMLVGRWRAGVFPVWSLRYLRFWAVRGLVRSNPLAAFAGTPLYATYLRLLGARIAPSAVVAMREVPVCTDLLEIGPGAVVGAHCLASGYKVVAGRVHTGPVVVGRNAYVGEGSLLDIHTCLGDGCELAHASSVHAHQRLDGGLAYHGSPAQPGAARCAPLAQQDAAAERDGRAPGPGRRIGCTAIQLATTWLVLLPIGPMLAYAIWGGSAEPGAGAAALDPGHGDRLLAALGWSWLLLLAGVPLGLVLVATVPRLYALALPADRCHPIFGWRYLLMRQVHGLSNVKFFNTLFGDSAMIVHYLGAIGYRFPGLQQTGSNFGLAQEHDSPVLCEFGSGTMVSDGLRVLNAELGRNVFRLSRVRIGARVFVGNHVHYPAAARVGDNCLLATKVMVPVDGPLRRDTGLLGSPPFAIPRSVQRDRAFDALLEPAVLAQRLRRKFRSNLLTAGGYLLSNGAVLSLGVALGYELWRHLPAPPGLSLALLVAGDTVLAALWMLAVDRASRGWRALAPRYCSIYDPYFWFHERHWKLGMSSDQPILALVAGTPLRGPLWRALGVQVGAQLFDDGCAIPEKTMVRIGDHCTLGAHVTLQCHSLEDGTFKSDRIVIGNGCSLGPNAFLHYGTRLEDGVQVAPDAFVMKGELLTEGTVWSGNPAQARQVVPALPDPARAAGPLADFAFADFVVPRTVREAVPAGR